ncbi:serpin B6-like [Brevipalpus obovatus]|uniref:serpin B6-like n=1 Tax=Brevipalpus obovatus TaxID=246614 RepID=UPI003D9E113B
MKRGNFDEFEELSDIDSMCCGDVIDGVKRRKIYRGLKSVLRETCNEFMIDIIHKIGGDLSREDSPDKDNFFISPLGIMVAYSMLLPGASGETRSQMVTSLRMDNLCNGMEIVHQEIHELLDYYQEQNGSNALSEIFTLGLLSDEKYRIKNTFLQFINQYYGAYLITDDLDPIDAANKINHCISERTKSRISCPIDTFSTENLFLTSVALFRGLWSIPFVRDTGCMTVFNNFDGSQSPVEMLIKRDIHFYYREIPEHHLKVIEIPYRGCFSLVIIMSTQQGKLLNFFSSQNRKDLKEFLSVDYLEPTLFSYVKIPPFKIENLHSLADLMSSLWMDLPFGAEADLSGVSEKFVFVEESFQQAVIEVNSESDEKSASINLHHHYNEYDLQDIENLNNKPKELTLDMPFFFAIRDGMNSISPFFGFLLKLSQPMSID